MPMDHVPRIAPLASPYEAEIATALIKWMPPGSAWEPLKLFRSLYRNPEISSRMRAPTDENRVSICSSTMRS